MPRIVCHYVSVCLLGCGLISFAGCNVATDGPPAVSPLDDVGVADNRGDNVGADIRVRDLSAESGIAFAYQSGEQDQANSILESLGGGVAVVDFDLDGEEDLFLPGGGGFEGMAVVGRSAGLMRNLGNARFENVAILAAVADDSLYTHGCHVADMDNDGFPDLLVTGYGSVRLYHNQGDGTYLEIHQAAGLLHASWSTAAAWGDLNGDGFADLYICNYVNWSFDNHPPCFGPQQQPDVCPPKLFSALPDVLYFSNGDGTFTDVSVTRGLVQGEEAEYSKGLGVVMADLDLDNDLDVYVANDTTPNYLYLNDGAGNLEEVGLVRSVALDSQGGANGSMGIDVGDYNGDQLPDLWVSNFEQEAFGLYENQGKGMFLHTSEKTGITSLGGLYVGFGTAFLDVDLDGDEDLLVTNGHVIKFPASGRVKQQPLMLVNDRRRRFVRRQFEASGYFGKEHAGRGMAVGDLTGDGQPEIVISHIGKPAALLATTSASGGKAYRVRLISRQGQRDAIGARVMLKTSDGIHMRLVKGGGSYMSQSEYRLYWGCPEGTQVESATVHWPGGKVESRTWPVGEQSVVWIESSEGGATQQETR